jgi:hypothetical protein
VPFLGGISAGELEVTGRSVGGIFHVPDSNLWRSKLDGSERHSRFADQRPEPRWSPDGKQIVFTDVPRRLFYCRRMAVVRSSDAQGRIPNTEVGVGCWMRDGINSLYWEQENPCDLPAEPEDTRGFKLPVRSKVSV